MSNCCQQKINLKTPREIKSVKDVNTIILHYFSVDKPAKLSSDYIVKTSEICHRAEKAVDGIYISDNHRESIAHSLLEYRPWWRMDLVDTYCVWAVNILNRGISKWQTVIICGCYFSYICF